MTHYSACTCSAIRTDNEAAHFNKEERKFISRTLICKYTQRTLDYKSIFGVLVFPDPSYLIDLTLTNLNCLYGEKLKLSFALTCFCLFMSRDSTPQRFPGDK